MAKMEKIGNMQVVDNKVDSFFCFPMISMVCTGSGYKEAAKCYYYNAWLLFLSPTPTLRKGKAGSPDKPGG